MRFLNHFHLNLHVEGSWGASSSTFFFSFSFFLSPEDINPEDLYESQGHKFNEYKIILKFNRIKQQWHLFFRKVIFMLEYTPKESPQWEPLIIAYSSTYLIIEKISFTHILNTYNFWQQNMIKCDYVQG